MWWDHIHTVFPYCRIGAVAFAKGKIAFEPLTPFFHMLDVRLGQAEYMEQVARAVEALKLSLDRLEAAYQASTLDEKLPIFPYTLADIRFHPFFTSECSPIYLSPTLF